MTKGLRKGFAAGAVAILIVEIIIAAWVQDGFVRPYLGDLLAVLLVYGGLRAAGLTASGSIAFALMISAIIELGQLVGLLEILSLETVALARIVLGSGFDPLDLVAYGCGGLLALIVEVVIVSRVRSGPLTSG